MKKNPQEYVDEHLKNLYRSSEMVGSKGFTIVAFAFYVIVTFIFVGLLYLYLS